MDGKRTVFLIHAEHYITWDVVSDIIAVGVMVNGHLVLHSGLSGPKSKKDLGLTR